MQYFQSRPHESIWYIGLGITTGDDRGRRVRSLIDQLKQILLILFQSKYPYQCGTSAIVKVLVSLDYVHYKCSLRQGTLSGPYYSSYSALVTNILSVMFTHALNFGALRRVPLIYISGECATSSMWMTSFFS